MIDAGPDLQPLIIERITHPSPRPVEYARLSRHRGNAPALTFFERGGTVNGQIMVLDLDDREEMRNRVSRLLWLREGKPPLASIRTMSLGGFATVYYVDIDPSVEPNPRLLADFAVASVAKCMEIGQIELNGIRYLRDCLAAGIVTPLSKTYEQAVLTKTLAKNLTEAEEKTTAKVKK